MYKSDHRDSSHITQFKGERFQLWRFQVEILFEAKKLLGVVDRSKEKSVDVAAKAQWLGRNNTAKLYIISAIDDVSLLKLVNCTITNKMWTRSIRTPDSCSAYR